MPSRWAVLVTAAGPTSSVRRTETVLSEFASACRSVTKTAHRLGITSKLDPPTRRSRSERRKYRRSSWSRLTYRSRTASGSTPARGANAHAGNRALYVRKDRQLGRVIDPTYVAMMSDDGRRSPARGTPPPEPAGWLAAGKTGTSPVRDAWFIGFTRHMVTGVWLGNDNSSPTKKLTGSSLRSISGAGFMKVARQRVRSAGRQFGGLFRFFGLEWDSTEKARRPWQALSRARQPARPRAP